MTRSAILRSSHFRLRVGSSEIHRRGVFALEDIPANRKVIEYTGKRLAIAQGVRLKAPRDRYVASLDNKWLVDGRIGGTGAELINHSCTPNLMFRRTRGHLYYFSRRKIRAGEELTSRYGYPIKITRVPCHCGSPKCRGTLRYLLR